MSTPAPQEPVPAPRPRVSVEEFLAFTLAERQRDLS
jgi:hypothetical protein